MPFISRIKTSFRQWLACSALVRWAISGEPLVWIERKGVGMNVPARTLRVEPLWADDEEKTVFAERYTDSDGTVVKQSCHVQLKKGLSMEGGQGSLG